MLNRTHKQARLHILLAFISFGTFCFANFLFAQPQPLPLPKIQQVSEVPPNLPQTGTHNGPLTLILTRMTPKELEQALRQICGHRFVAEGQYQYVFSADQDNLRRQCTLRIEPQVNRAVLSGDKQLCDQVFMLITAIDQEPPKGRERQIIPYLRIKPDVLAQALNAYRVQRLVQPGTRPQNNTAVRLLNPEPNPNPHPIRLVEYQFQEGFDMGTTELPRTGMPGDPAAINMSDEFLQWLVLPQLEAVIVDADGARLARVKEMIQQLEELSELNKPQIEIIYLKHVNNAALASNQNGVIYQIYNELFQITHGTVRVIPLISPNAVLLVGWGKSMETMRDLIQSLDQPIAAENARFRFFKLKNIPAQQAQTVLRGAFPTPAGPSGFTPRVSYVIDERTNLLIVQAAPNDMEEVAKIIAEIDVSDSAPKLLVKPIHLKHTLAPDLRDTLDRVFTSGTTGGRFPALELRIQSEEGQKLITSGIMSDVSIQADVRNNHVIVKAPERCMAFIEELINLLDRASPEAEIKVFPIEYGHAESLVEMLRRLIPSNIDGEPGPQLPGAANEETLIPMRLSFDSRTNCVVAAGSPGDMKVVEALLKYLDREDLLSRQEFVYPLKSMTAADVADTLTTYITSRRRIQQDAPGVVSEYQQIESEVIVVPHTESNSLIISATPRYYDEMIRLIKEIDKSPPQVLIKVLIAEVTLSDTAEWGAEFGFQDPLMLNRTSATGGGLLFNTKPETSLGGTVANSGTVGSQLLTNFGTGRTGMESGFSGTVFSASSDWINVMIRVLQEQNRLEVLSSPKITALNNKPAAINVGQDIIRSTGGSINPQTGAIQMETTEKEIGLVFTVTPSISPEGTIVMVIVAQKSTLGSEQEGTAVAIAPDGTTVRSPKIDVIKVTTVVSAANNQTVVLGGLLSKETQRKRRKVPLLGDVPIAGKLFRYEFDRTRKTELLLILTPEIIKEGTGDMDRIRQMEFARMSWCLRNVVQTYGDLGAYSVVAERPYTGDAPIYTPAPVKREDLQPIESPIIVPTLPKK